MSGLDFLMAILFGVVAGLRTFTAPAAVAWTVHFAHLDLTGSRLAFLGSGWARWILTGMALLELVFDQLPWTPPRTVVWQFGGRLMTGALSGAAVGAAAGQTLAGALAGLVGAVIGTLVGVRARTRLAGTLGNDHAAGLIEDAVAIGGVVALAMVAS